MLLGGVASRLHAEDGPTLVITGGRSDLRAIEHPGLVSVVDSEDIANSKAATLADVLAGQPGIQLTDLYGDGTQTTVDMRGFGAAAVSNVLILVDGQRLNNSADIAAPALNRIPVEQIERIEIIRGSAGVLFGNQAVGGLVNIVTRDAQLPGAYVEGTGGSFNQINGQFGVSRNLGDDVSLRVDGSYGDSDNYREHNKTRLRLLGSRLHKAYQGGAVFADLRGGRETQELPGSLFAPEVGMNRRGSAEAYVDDFRETDFVTGRVGIEHRLSDHWRLDGEANWRREDGEFLASFRAFPGSPATQNRTLWSLYPRLTGMAGGIDVTLGADLENTDYELVTSFGPQLVDQSIWGLYAIAGMPFGDLLRATAGIRRTGVDNDITAGGVETGLGDTVTLATATLDFLPEPGWRAFLRADQNIRFATVEEHTNIVFGQPTGISNQPGISWETGIEWSNARTDLKITAYQLDLRDEISFNADTFTNTNLDRTRRRGFTLEGAFAPAAGWRLGGQYTYTDGKITDGSFDGNRIPLVARQTGRVYTRGRMAGALTLFAEAIYTGDQIIGGDFRNTYPPLDASAVVNTAITYEKHGWQLAARIDNLFNNLYNASAAVGFDETFTPKPAFFPAPERRFTVSLRYDF